MEAVKNTKQYVDYQAQKSGSGCGCWAIGCGSIILLLMVLCGGGFYTMFYSSAPLKFIEAAIEESGEVEIEGLSGNFMSGFTIDELRFKSEGDKWSSLTNIKFKYKSSWFRSDRLIIEDISVDGGTIYANFDSSGAELEFDPNFDSGFNEARDEIQNEMGGNFSAIKEVRIDLIRIANLKIIDPDTEDTITLDEIKFDGFHFEEGVLTNMGSLLVESSQLEIKTTTSDRLSEYANAKRFTGKLSADMDRRLIKDMPIDVDLAFDDQGEMIYFADAFEGAFVAERKDKVTKFTLKDLSLADYFKSETSGVMPSKINIKFSAEKGFLPKSIEKDGSFYLGETQFSKLTLDPNSTEGNATIIGTSESRRGTTMVRVNMRRSSWGRITLSSNTREEPNDLWAQTIFGKEYANLNAGQRMTIDKTILFNTRTVRKSEPEMEAEKSAEDVPAEAPEGRESLLPIK